MRKADSLWLTACVGSLLLGIFLGYRWRPPEVAGPIAATPAGVSGAPDSRADVTVLPETAPSSLPATKPTDGEPGDAEPDGGEDEDTAMEMATIDVLVPGLAASGLEGDVRLVDAGADVCLQADLEAAGADGKAVLGPVVPGEYTLCVNVGSEGRSFRYNFPCSTYDLGPGTNGIQVELPAPHRVTVLLEGMDPGWRVEIRSKDNGVRRGYARWDTKKVGEERKVVFDHVPAGTYEVQVEGGEVPQRMTFEVRAPATVRFRDEPFDAYRVRIADPSKALGQAGLREGDLIIGIDGEEFTRGAPQLKKSLFAALIMARKAKLMVLREGEKIDVEAAPKDILLDPQGGELEPVQR
jgi:hypothetical protein